MRVSRRVCSGVIGRTRYIIININIIYIYIYKHRIVTEQNEKHKKKEKSPGRYIESPVRKVQLLRYKSTRLWNPALQALIYWTGPRFAGSLPFILIPVWLFFSYLFMGFFSSPGVSRLPLSAAAATPNDLYPLIGKARQREIIIITFPPKIPQIHATHIYYL